jgi:hypothetical protein
MTRCPARDGAPCERTCGDFDGRGTRWRDAGPEVGIEFSYYCQDRVFEMTGAERFERNVPQVIIDEALKGRPRPAPSRQELRAICAKALDTPESAWSNRDSYAATKQLGEAYALLSAGCEILSIERDDKLHTWWVTIASKGFNYFEGTVDGMGEKDEDRFYVPFIERVITGEDWY